MRLGTMKDRVNMKDKTRGYGNRNHSIFGYKSEFDFINEIKIKNSFLYKFYIFI